MPKSGSEKQIEPSDFTAASFGLFRRSPRHRSASTVTVPSCSVRVTRRLPCSQVISRPSRSRVLPLVYPAKRRKTATEPVSSSRRSIRSLGMSLQTTPVDSTSWMGDSAQDFAALPEILEAHVIAGGASVLVKVRTATTEQLQDVLRRIYAIDGVSGARATVVLETFFERPLSPLPADQP
jgi:hypothetical protein